MANQAWFLFSVERSGVEEGEMMLSASSESTAMKLFCVSKQLCGEFKTSESGPDLQDGDGE